MSDQKFSRESIRWLILEGTAIIVSILLAFAIDAWWQDRQDVSKRQKLVAALKTDFETTQGRLVESIEHADELIERGTTFLGILDNQDSYSLEELGYLVSCVSYGIFFKESLIAYDSAVATGSIQLVANSNVVEAIARFSESLEIYRVSDEFQGSVFFLGSIWQLRREIGSSTILSYDPDEDLGRLQLSETELRELYASKLVYASVQNVTLVNLNKRRALEEMQTASRDILTALDRLLD